MIEGFGISLFCLYLCRGKSPLRLPPLGESCKAWWEYGSASVGVYRRFENVITFTAQMKDKGRWTQMY